MTIAEKNREELAKKRDEFKALSSAFLPTSIVLSAIELGVFDALASGPQPPAAVAARVQADARSVGVLLSSLAALGYVNESGGSFENGELASTYLVRGAPQYEGDSAQMSLWFMRLAAGLSDVVRTGQPRQTMEEAVGSDPHLGALIARSMDQIAPDFLPAVLEHVPVGPTDHILDIGGAAGTYAHAMVARSPGARATVAELPNAAREARALIAARGWSQVDVLACDFRHEPLGGPYSVVFLSNVLHLLDPDAAATLLKRATAALRPGGRVVIKEMLGAEEGASPAGLAAYAVLMLLVSRGGRLHPESSYRRWCKGAGLSPPDRIDCWARSSLLIAHRPG